MENSTTTGTHIQEELSIVQLARILALMSTLSFACLVVGCTPNASARRETPRSIYVPKALETDEGEWALVEERAEAMGLIPDGADYRAGAQILIAKRIVPQIEGALVVQIELARVSARVGDMVDAKLYVANGNPRAYYEITVEPTRDSVRILPSKKFIVRGRERVKVQFTSFADGQGGVSVTCREIPKPAQKNSESSASPNELR